MSETPSAEEHAVIRANEAFYRTFRERDIESMRALWSMRETVSCTHPGTRTLYGRKAVLASWKALLANPRTPRIIAAETRVSLVSETVALVTCHEGLESGGAALCATNLFVREENGWRLLHHHTSALAPTPARPSVAPGLLN